MFIIPIVSEADRQRNERYLRALAEELNSTRYAIYTVCNNKITINTKNFQGPLIVLCNQLSDELYDIAILDLNKHEWEILPSVKIDDLMSIDDTQQDAGSLLFDVAIKQDNIAYRRINGEREMIFLYNNKHYKACYDGSIEVINSFRDLDTYTRSDNIKYLFSNFQELNKSLATFKN